MWVVGSEEGTEMESAKEMKWSHSMCAHSTQY